MGRHCTRVLLAVCATVLGACGEQTLAPSAHERPAGKPANAFPVTVSEPVRTPLGSFMGAAMEDGQSFVSLDPGAVPGGEVVQIRNAANGYNVEYPLVEGGLDPVPVPASVGDTIVLKVELVGGTTVQSARAVSAELNPRIVRTRPPARKKDVPLNAVIEVVFSEPMQDQVLAGAVILLRGQEVVGTTVRFRDQSRTLVEVVPNDELAPETEYRVLVDSDARDLSGAALEAGVDVAFTTARGPEAVRVGSLSAGAEHTCGVTLDGRLVCWGTTVASQFPLLMPLAGLDGVAAGGTTICGYGMSVRCIAGNQWVLGASGTGSFAVDFATLTSGGDHVCGLLEDGAIRCWGRQPYAINGWYYTNGPRAVQRDSALVMLVSGADHDCGLTAGGTAYCWGSADYGQTGSFQLTNHETDSTFFRAFPVQTELRFRTLGAGGNSTCGITLGGELYCWGEIMGNGYYSAEPVHVPTPVPFTSVHPGERHACGLDADGAAWCWGREVTDQGIVVRAQPDAPIPTHRFTALSAGSTHTCGLTADQEVYCWGDNTFRQLGDGTNTSRSEPIRVEWRP